MFPTYANVKTYLGIATADTSKDDKIKLLLPSVMEEILSTTGDISKEVYIDASDVSFSEDEVNSTETDFVEADFAVGMWILVEGSSLNKLRIAKLTAVETHKLTIDITNYGEGNFVTEAAKEEVIISQIAVPKAMKAVALEMMAHKMNNGVKGVKSESIGDYSASYSETYPKSITDVINKYRKLR